MISSHQSYLWFILDIEDKEEPCYDTSTITRKDWAGWGHRNISLQHILRFIGLQADVIHREDPKVDFLIVKVDESTFYSLLQKSVKH